MAVVMAPPGAVTPFRRTRVGRHVFKSLRDRLQGVASQLEDELEAQLEAELEAELAGTTSKEEQPEATVEEPAAPDAVPPSQESDEGEPARADESEPAPAPVPGPASEPSPDTARETAPPEDPQPPKGEATEQRGPEAEPTPEAPPPAEERAAPAPPPRQEQEPTPEAPPEAAAKAAKAAQPITGRKMLSEEELEARIARELGEAVEVEREVEKVVQESGVKTRYTINEDVLEDILWELEVGLLESDVALPVIEAIKANVKDQLLSMAVGGRSPAEVVEKVLRAAVRRVLNVNAVDFDGFVRERLESGKRPVVVMFVGVNGTGKTTSIARMAYRLQQNGISSVMAAGDTFRAGAIEQLTQHGDKLGIKVVKHNAGADPAAVAYDAIEHAKARHKDVVLLDTAGRMQTNTNLMDEMDKIRRVADPDMVVFVGDSLAGNDAVEQARRFDEVVDIDGAILTKTDVDAKGGAALSVAYTINKPLLFIGVGQGYEDLEPFSADVMVDRLFGAGAA